jgi:hypothetical protein
MTLHQNPKELSNGNGGYNRGKIYEEKAQEAEIEIMEEEI